jgi:hypothetical protein
MIAPRLRFALAGALVTALAAAGTASIAAQAPPPASRARAARVVALPKLDGANLKVHAIEVTSTTTAVP